MNLLNSVRALNFIKTLIFLLAFFAQVSVRAWDVDFSRRQKDLQNAQGPGNVSAEKPSDNVLDAFLENAGPTQELVILNTEKGFIPETVHLKKGNNYRIHVVNVSEKDKNVSFIIDAFSQHMGTFYGQPKSFSVVPQAEGVFSFQCPETSKQGRIVVISDDQRKPASK